MHAITLDLLMRFIYLHDVNIARSVTTLVSKSSSCDVFSFLNYPYPLHEANGVRTSTVVYPIRINK